MGAVQIAPPVTLASLLTLYGPLLPAAFVCVGIAAFGFVTSWVAPHSARIWYDPSLQYLGSSLGWFRGQSYAYIDHPGTPVEVLGTAILAISYPFVHMAGEGFVSHYLNYPQDFLNIAQSFVLCFSVTVTLLLARFAIAIGHWTQAVVGAAIAILFFVLLQRGEYIMPEAAVAIGDGFRAMSLWSHESFCFPAGSVLSLAVLITVRRAGPTHWGTVLRLGVASGVLTSIQLYFAAWVVGTAVALTIAAHLAGAGSLRSLARGVVVFIAAGVGFIVATLPIHDHYAQFVSWTFSLVTHQGLYGSGPAGPASLDVLTTNLVALIAADAPVFISCIIAAILLASRLLVTRRYASAHPVAWAAGIGFTVQLIVVLLLVTKHPHPRYLLPAAATIPLLIAAALDPFHSWPSWLQRSLIATAFLALTVFAFNVRTNTLRYIAEADWLRRMDIATESALTQLATERHIPRQSLRTLWTYGTNSNCYGLWLANEYAGHAFRNDLAKICPQDGWIYPVSSNVATESGPVPLSEYEDWDVAVLIDGWYGVMAPVSTPPSSTRHASSILTVRGLGTLAFVTR